MQEASVQGILRTIFIILLIYYAIKVIGRFAFPILFKKFVGNIEKKMRDSQQPKTDSKTKVGETLVDSKPKTNTSNNDVGEYVDYEEIE